MRRQSTLLSLAVACLVWAQAAPAQPGRVDLKTEVLYEFDGAHPGGTARFAIQCTLPSQYHVNSNKPLEDYLIPTTLTLELPDGMTLTETVFPEPVMLALGGSDTPLAVFEAEFTIGGAIAIGPGIAPGKFEIPASIRYQACDDKACYAPTKKALTVSVNVVSPETPLNPLHPDVFKGLTIAAADVPGEATAPDAEPVTSMAEEGEVLALLDRFEILGTTGGYLKAEAFLEWVKAAESGQVQTGWFEGKGPIAIVALILVGGLALNLTPCVLPMIPINIAIIGAGARAGSRTRGFALGGAYGLAMALVYGVLGLGVILTAGTFGQINASPWFNIGIAVLFVVLALAMFDVINIDFSKFQAKLKLGKPGSGSFLVAFGMGAVAALLAGACVAPVVIQVIVFSSDLYAKGETPALALPFLLGVGMALPWPIAGAGMSFLPKPGMWMVRVKQAFGVFILGFAAYYAYLGYEIINNRMVDAEEVAGSVDAMVEEGWYPSPTQGLQAALAENKPVLIDMWATWCKNCLTMDKTTFKNEQVLARLDGYTKIKFQAEDLEASPAREVLERFNGIGLPTYAILKPKN